MKQPHVSNTKSPCAAKVRGDFFPRLDVFFKVLGLDAFFKALGLDAFFKALGLDAFFKALGLDAFFKTLGLDVFFKVLGLDVFFKALGLDAFFNFCGASASQACPPLPAQPQEGMPAPWPGSRPAVSVSPSSPGESAFTSAPSKSLCRT